MSEPTCPPPAPATPKVDELVKNVNSPIAIAAANAYAKKHYAAYPRMGCAACASSFLILSGIDVKFTVNAQALADALKARCWQRIECGHQRPGDFGVTADTPGTMKGTDHVYIVSSLISADLVNIVDNQGKTQPHKRSLSGQGRTRTVYLLRGQG